MVARVVASLITNLVDMLVKAHIKKHMATTGSRKISRSKVMRQPVNYKPNKNAATYSRTKYIVKYPMEINLDDTISNKLIAVRKYPGMLKIFPKKDQITIVKREPKLLMYMSL